MGTRIRRSLVITALGLGTCGLGVAASVQADTLTLAYQATPAAPVESVANGSAPPSWLSSGLQDRELENVSGTGVDATADQVHTQTVGVILWDEQGTKSRGRHGSMELPASVTSIRLPDGVELTH